MVGKAFDEETAVAGDELDFFVERELREQGVGADGGVFEGDGRAEGGLGGHGGRRVKGERERVKAEDW